MTRREITKGIYCGDGFKGMHVSKLSDIVLQMHAVYRMCLVTTKMVFKKELGWSIGFFFSFIFL